MGCLPFLFELLMAGVGVWTYLAGRLAPRRYSPDGPVYSVRGPWARRAGAVMVLPLLVGLPCGVAQVVLLAADADPGWVGLTLLVVQGVVLVSCGMVVNWIWWTRNSPEDDGPGRAAQEER